MTETLIRSAATAPTSWSEKDRTVDVNFSTFADVQRVDSRGPYIERLDKSGLDLSRLVGASVLNSHRQTNLGDILGVVLKATKDGVAKLQLSARSDVAPFVADIAAGLIRHLSIRYSIGSWKESIDPKSGARIKTAVRWTPVEISFVPVPADFGAQTRSGASKMEPEENAPEVPANVTPANAVRNQAIRSICQTNGMTREFTDALIDGDGDVIAARAAVNAEMIRKAPTIRPQAAVGFSNEDPAVIRERRIEARFVRDNGGTLSDAARPHVHETTLDWAKDSLQRAGVSTRGMSADEIFQRAATHGTSDWPEHLGGVGRRVALAAYTAAPAALKTIARQSTNPDFRAKALLRMSNGGLLEEISEHGEIKSTTRYESVESYSLRTFARMIGVTRKALIQDDLGGLSDMARMFGIAAAQTEAAELVTLLESNPVLDDSVALFDASRNNVDLSNTQISVEAISDARLAMRKLTDADGTLISVTPKYLVVSAELETAAQVFLASFQPTQMADVQPFTLSLVVEPRLAAYTWYLAADPSQSPEIEYAHLSGAQGVVVESQAQWNTLGMSWRAYLDFGCGVVGKGKGLYKFASGEDSNSLVL